MALDEPSAHPAMAGSTCCSLLALSVHPLIPMDVPGSKSLRCCSAVNRENTPTFSTHSFVQFTLSEK